MDAVFPDLLVNFARCFTRIGSFGSGITDHMVDGYRILSVEGGTLGTIYLCPYCTRTSSRAPAGFAMVGDAFLPRTADDSVTGDDKVEEVPRRAEVDGNTTASSIDKLAALRSAALDKLNLLAQFNLASHLIELSAAGNVPAEALERLRLAASCNFEPAKSLLSELQPKPARKKAAIAPEADQYVPRPRGSSAIDFPNGVPQDKLDFRLFAHGVSKGRDCLE